MLLWVTPVNGEGHYQVLESVCFLRPVGKRKFYEEANTFVCLSVNPNGTENGYYIKETVDDIYDAVEKSRKLQRPVSA